MENKLMKAKELLEREGYKVTKAGKEAGEWVKVLGTDYEVTRDVLYKGKSYNEIMQLKKSDEELLTLELIGIICKDKDLMRTLKMDGSSTKDDFFFEQPFPQNKAKGYVARFYLNSDYANLYCYRDADDSDSALGVRFARKILKKK